MALAPIPPLHIGIPEEVRDIVDREASRTLEAIAADRRRPVFEFTTRSADDIFAELDRRLG